MSIQKTPFALSSLRDQVLYLEENASPEIAERYIDAVEATLLFIEKESGVGSPCQFLHPRLHGLRRWPVSGFENYLLFYQETKEGILLLYVFHGHQDIDFILSDPPE